MVTVSASVKKGLAEKAKKHNEKVGNAKTKRTSTRTLIAVFAGAWVHTIPTPRR